MKRFWSIERERNRSPIKETWFTRHSSEIQFGLAALGLFGLYFSYQANVTTKKALEYQMSKDKSDSIHESNIDSINHRKDSLQLLIMSAQNDFIAQQLVVQKNDLVLRDEIEKPNLTLDSIKIRIKNAKDGILDFSIKNISGRTAHVFKTLEIKFNKHYKYFTINNNCYNLDLFPKGSLSFMTEDKIGLLLDTTTVYYTKFFYKDLGKRTRTKEIFFIPNAVSFSYKNLRFAPVNDKQKRELYQYMKKNISNWGNLMNNESFCGKAIFKK